MTQDAEREHDVNVSNTRDNVHIHALLPAFFVFLGRPGSVNCYARQRTNV
jgi:hypothetical protein